ncbi:unnamed protein product [Alopecurus aequalis]
MRNPTPFVFLNDVPREFLDGGDLGHCPGAGLCWPADPLDKVIDYVSMLGDGFLEDLGLDCSLPDSRLVHDGSDYAGRAQEDMETDTGALAARDEAGTPGGRKRSACHVFDSAPQWLPPPQAPSFSCSPASSGRRSLSPTSEPQEHPPEEDDLRWTLQKKPHHRRLPRRRHAWPSWTLSLPLPLMAPDAHDDDDDKNKDKDFELMSYLNKGGANGLPRPPGAGRQRQRKQAGKDGTEKICTHCRASETPQWRAGPAGNSTLCNACGIRYKMGKLFPEYRPSNSPEFSSNEHSNRHRNVERIRQRKKLKVMAPEVLPPPADDKALLQVCKYET